MSATSTLTHVVFWGHVVGAVVLAVGAIAVHGLVDHLDFSSAGVESAPWARTSLERGVPAGVGLFAVAVLGYGFAYLGGAVTAADPAVSALTVVERIALLVPGGTVGQWAGIAGLVVFNGAVLLSVLDLGYRLATTG